MKVKKIVREQLRTWVEIDSRAVAANCQTFRALIGPKVKLWAVVKSNAYGHGLLAFSKIANRCGAYGFCVDSVVEGIALRRAGIKKPILVLGFTLPSRFAEAARQGITISIANEDSLKALLALTPKEMPDFHLKIDTGMHRQGFYIEDFPKAVAHLRRAPAALKARLKGVFTHFASAKDVNYPAYTDMQFAKFEKAVKILSAAGFKNLMRHAAATGGTLAGKKYHLDAVRVGIGLYGLWPSKELEMQLGGRGGIKLKPVLSWRTILADVKPIGAGDYVGYDLTERVPHATTMAVLPIGYWHGFPRALSSVGEAIVGGTRAKVLGRVSMDMTVIDVGALKGKMKAKPGDVATLIGRDGGETIFAWEPSMKSGTTYYEFLTRLNPLMERIVV